MDNINIAKKINITATKITPLGNMAVVDFRIEYNVFENPEIMLFSIPVDVRSDDANLPQVMRLARDYLNKLLYRLSVASEKGWS